ncbi:MAG: MBL fold metallo-hydrolase [Pseudolabrys sp.]|nr:MBL fold metallo-hydrolase [Pseudolabrys sp.]
MSVFKVGKATITRIEETYQAIYPVKELFPACTDDILKHHGSWLPPHYDATSGKIKLSVHSWLLQIDGRKILIDCCCGNHKPRPQRPWWNMLNEPYLDRLAAAGARPDEIDLVMCTHLHHDHLGWNTMQRDGKWVPTFPNARYVFSKLDFDHFKKVDEDPKTTPAEFGTFKECVVPVVDAGKADLVTGPHKLNEFIDIEPAGGHSPGHFVFKVDAGGGIKAMLTGDVFHHLLQVYYPDWNFPKNSDAEQAKRSRRKVFDELASTGAMVFPGHVGAPFAGYIEKDGSNFRPRF